LAAEAVDLVRVLARRRVHGPKLSISGGYLSMYP
jgi:hypothetical protein